MEKKFSDFIFILVCVLIVGAIIGGVIVNRAHTRTVGRVGSESSAAGDIKRELGDEQLRTLDNITASADGVGRVIESFERIRGITENTNSTLRELGEVNRRSSDISAAIRAEVELLADYFRRVNSVIDDFDNPTHSELKE